MLCVAFVWDFSGGAQAFTLSISTVVSSVRDISASMHAAQELCGLLCPLCGLLKPLCGLFNHLRGLTHAGCGMSHPLHRMM